MQSRDGRTFFRYLAGALKADHKNLTSDNLIILDIQIYHNRFDILVCQYVSYL